MDRGMHALRCFLLNYYFGYFDEFEFGEWKKKSFKSTEYLDISKSNVWRIFRIETGADGNHSGSTLAHSSYVIKLKNKRKGSSISEKTRFAIPHFSQSHVQKSNQNKMEK